MQETEWDILGVLWDQPGATAREVTDALTGVRDWSYSTVKTMLDRMVAKGLASATRVGNVWSYTAAMPRVDAQRSAWKRFVETVFDGGMGPALRFIAQDAKLTRRQREALLALLEGGDDA